MPVFEDPYARALSGRILNIVQAFGPLTRLVFRVALKPIMPASLCVLLRARYTEDCLDALVDQGMRQYVILGAGMDSFGFRRRDLMQRIQLFEVDHPVTQAKKLRRVRRAGLDVVPNHHFVVADLSDVSPFDALAPTPFDTSEPAFFSLLGVSYYLTENDLRFTLRALSRGMQPGTRMVVDYLLRPESCGPDTESVRQELHSFVRRRGEPMRSSYSMRGMSDLVADAGFRTVENVRMVDLSAAYRDDLESTPYELPDIFAVGHFEVA